MLHFYFGSKNFIRIEHDKELIGKLNAWRKNTFDLIKTAEELGALSTNNNNSKINRT